MITNGSGDSSQLVYARIAGVAYILVILIGVLSGAFVDLRLIVPGDVASTARQITAHQLLFRAGILGALVMYAGVLVLSGALYVVLEKVNRPLALLAMLLRSAEAIVGVATVLPGLTALSVFAGEARSTASDPELLDALVSVLLEARSTGLNVVLFVLGLGGTVFGLLFFMSRYVPRALAIWGIFTYSSILVLALASILVPTRPEVIAVVLYALGGAFELVLGFWLLLRGVDLHAKPEALR